MNEQRGMLAKIHIAKKDLGLDDDTYRAIIARHGCGKTSSRDLTITQLDSVLREFTGKGWQPKQPKAGKRPKPAQSRIAMMAKIEALLAEKARRDGHAISWNYAHAIAKRVAKVERLEFCTDDGLRKVVAALSYSAAREIARYLEAEESAPPSQPSPMQGEGAIAPPSQPSPMKGEGANSPSQPSPIRGEGANSPAPLWGGVGAGELRQSEGAQ